MAISKAAQGIIGKSFRSKELGVDISARYYFALHCLIAILNLHMIGKVFL